MCGRTPGAVGVLENPGFFVPVTQFRGHKKHHEHAKGERELFAEFYIQSGHAVMLPNSHYPGKRNRWEGSTCQPPLRFDMLSEFDYH